MKLYFAPGACSLADHIALHEAGMSFDRDQVDLKAKTTSSGASYLAVNAKGYVPALTLDSGETLTENIAILDWVAHQAPAMAPPGPTGHTHHLEMLAFIATELHKSFAPFFQGGSDGEKAKAGEKLAKRFAWIADQLQGDYLFGADLSAADCYLFVMTMWAHKTGLEVPPALKAFRTRMMERSAVKLTLAHEGLA